MYDCHLFWHEDQGMMGQFVGVQPGQELGLMGAEDYH
ncbi:multicopper oxidase domain-containing protein [Rhodococcus sp. NPDC057014]